jgi:hypothetical protein
MTTEAYVEPYTEEKPYFNTVVESGDVTVN